MTKLIRYLKPYKLQLLALVVLVFGAVSATLQLPDYMAKIINQGVVGGDNSIIVHYGLLMLLVALAGAACTMGVGYLSSRIATGFSRDIRNEVFSSVEAFSLTEFNKFSIASLITRSTNDVQQIQSVMLMLLRMVIQAPIMGLWAIIKAYYLAPSLSWIIALAVVVLLGVITIIFSIALPKFKLLQKLVDRLNSVTRENLTGLRVIRAFNNEELQQGKFEKANLELTDTNLFVNRLMVVMRPAMNLILNLALILIVWMGAKLIGTGSLEVGSMMAFMQYAIQVISAFLMISMVFIMLPRASVSAHRINEIIEMEGSIKDAINPVDAEVLKGGELEFRNVSFSYLGADSPVLENISFTAKSGETTAMIGATGSGKSTIINLIPRFYDVSSGQVLLNGVDVRDYRLEDLYSKIGLVPQTGVLFSGTILSNISYGNPLASQEEIESAARVSQAQEFIDKLDLGLNAQIAQGGANISGGQKQRLAIARAIAKNPEIYIFDDSFSALDFETDAKLRLSLKEATKEKTVLIVAQRISTIIRAEKIIVLDEGKIVDQGTHEELMMSCDIYQEIASVQLSEEELKGYSLNNSKREASIELKD